MQWNELAKEDCSLARSLAVVGDRWTLLVLREAFLRTRRFDDFEAKLGIARRVLSERLALLVDEGILKKLPYQDNPPRFEYRLTDKGLDLYPVIISLVHWGDRHYAGADQEQRFADLRSQVPGLRFSDFMGMWESEERGDAKGAGRAFARGRLNAAKDAYSALRSDAMLDGSISPEEQAALDRQQGVVRSLSNLDKQPAIVAKPGGRASGGSADPATTMRTAADTMLEAAKLMRKAAGSNDHN